MPTLNTSNWAAGCNGNPYGSFVWPTPTGTYFDTIPTPNVGTGALSQSLGTHSPPSSSVQVASWFMVGPAASPYPGCYYPSTAKSGLTVTYTWSITENPYLAANCTGDQGPASASLTSNSSGNVHIGSSPWYVRPGGSANVNILPPQTVTCSNGGSVVWAPGPLNYPAVTVTFSNFAVNASTTYDFYSAIWTHTSSSAASGTFAVSLDTVTATLVSVSCPAC